MSLCVWGGEGGSSHEHCSVIKGCVTPPRSQTAPCSETLSCPGQVTFVRKHDLMQTIVRFPSNLFAFMKIQFKNMRICVCFHQLCNANKKGHQPNKVTHSGKFLCSAVAAHTEARTCREREARFRYRFSDNSSTDGYTHTKLC